MKKSHLAGIALGLSAVLACTNQQTSALRDGDDVTQPASGERAYSCSLVDDFDSWSVEIKLGASNGARFFDNDHWSDLNDYSYLSLESNPPQDQHTFTGVDTFYSDLSFSFVFNETKGTGVLVETSTSETNSYEFTCEAETVASQPADCSAALSDDYSRDAYSFHLHIDEFDHELDSGAAAMAVAKLAAAKTGCDAGTIVYSDTEQASSACKEILPGASFSKACYVSTNVGYFLVSETLPEGLAVTWSRWD